MAFTVEDGTGLANANALASVADVSAYLTDRGLTAFAALATGAKQTAIVQATEYLSSGFAWLGEPVKPYIQALALPRVIYVPQQGMIGGLQVVSQPVDVTVWNQPAILAAVSRLAYEVGVSSVDLFARVSSKNLVKSTKAGSVAVEFADAAIELAASGRPSFPYLYELLGPYLDGGQSSINRKVVRS